MKPTKKNKIITDLDFLDFKISEEEQKEIDDYFDNFDHELAQKIHDNYGKPSSLFLKEVKEAGFNPIAITVMLCEETFVFNTEVEAKEAADKFLPEGWWDNKESFLKSREDYVNKFYDGVEKDAPIVYWLN